MTIDFNGVSGKLIAFAEVDLNAEKYSINCNLCGRISFLLTYPKINKMYKCYHCGKVIIIRALWLCPDLKCEMVHMISQYIPDCGWEITK